MKQVKRAEQVERVGRVEAGLVEVGQKVEQVEAGQVEVEQVDAGLEIKPNVQQVEQKGLVLVSAPTVAGEAFVRLLRFKGVGIAALSNNDAESQAMARLGVEQHYQVDTHSRKDVTPPPFAIALVCLFERSLPLTSLYIQLCRRFTPAPIVVVTQGTKPRLIYRSLGATEVLYSTSGEALYRRLISLRN
jgi:hypothetical protein